MVCLPAIRGIQYVRFVMHKCIMVKLGGKRKTQKVCKKHRGNASLPQGGWTFLVNSITAFNQKLRKLGYKAFQVSSQSFQL